MNRENPSFISALESVEFLKPGDNIIEFMPDKAGTTCWMGMVASSIQVVDDIGNVDLAANPVPVGGVAGMACYQPR